MKDLTLLLCDREEEYAHLMTEFVLRSTGISWCVRTYTQPREMLRVESEVGDCRKQGDILLLAENAYVEGVTKLPVKCLIVLEEGYQHCLESYPHIKKYQAADQILRMLLEIYADRVKDFCGTYLTEKENARFIGFYSPVHRCMQTTLAFALSLALAGHGKTLYLSLEYYSGLKELWPGENDRDLADLLYFLHAQEERFPLRLQSCVRRLGDLDYIPPMKVGENLLGISAAEWLKLLQKLGQEGGYQYIVLDLSENIQGLFQILRSCKKVVTIQKSDLPASVKQSRYEEMLRLYHYEDVLDKTCKLQPLSLSEVPESWEEYEDCGLREQIQQLLSECT